MRKGSERRNQLGRAAMYAFAFVAGVFLDTNNILVMGRIGYPAVGGLAFLGMFAAFDLGF